MPGRRPSLDDHVSTLILGSSDCKTVENKCLLFKPHNSWYFVIVVWAKTGGISSSYDGSFLYIPGLYSNCYQNDISQDQTQLWVSIPREVEKMEWATFSFSVLDPQLIEFLAQSNVLLLRPAKIWDSQNLNILQALSSINVTHPLVNVTFLITYHFYLQAPVVLKSLIICACLLRFSSLPHWAPNVAVHWNQLGVFNNKYWCLAPNPRHSDLDGMEFNLSIGALQVSSCDSNEHQSLDSIAFISI